MLATGDEVPDFSLTNAEGKIVKKSELKGKKYVVYFYPKDFTPGCTIEAEEFARDYKKFKNAGVEIVGISPDDEQSHKKFGEKMKVPFILLSDTKTEVAKKFGVWGKKQFMGREYMGVNRSTFLVNEKGKIFKVFEKVKPSGHAQEVLEAFKN
ncbi:MAG: thioredoxin-dependent thiol peroxidase [Thaumarchaeota archaeon]|nr:MAG: thioredoxin-dependent thiol peroxidase [Nitrososphaerota archaeon]